MGFGVEMSFLGLVFSVAYSLVVPSSPDLLSDAMPSPVLCFSQSHLHLPTLSPLLVHSILCFCSAMTFSYLPSLFKLDFSATALFFSACIQCTCILIPPNTHISNIHLY